MLQPGDQVKVRRTMHTWRESATASLEMVREGRVVRMLGKSSAIVRVNLKRLANGEWKTEDMRCLLSSLEKLERVSA